MTPLSDDAEAEDAAQPADDGANDENEVMSAAADGSIEISNETQLRECLQKGGSYCLAKDMTYDGQIDIRDVTAVLNLNGHKICHNGENGNNYPLFNVHDGANFTIQDLPKEDLLKVQDQKFLENGNKNGNLAKLDYKDGTPIKLTYYVTESSVNAEDSTRTIETTYKHEVAINGAIVGTADNSTMQLINVYEGGTFNLESGVLTTAESAKVGSLIYAENGSIVNMSGGYVCGATSMSQGAGIELGVKDGNGATLNLTGGVIAGNYAPNGGGVYANGSTINMTGGTISGNGTFEDQAGYGAGICALGSTVTISDGYITNNNNQYNYEVKNGANHKGNGCHGGGGIAAYNGGSLQISGGCITGNYSAEAGGGVYAGYWTQPLNKFKVCGGIIASNVAELSEGGGIRIAAPTVGEFEVAKGSHAYITNNTTNTTNDWGGGGVFVQGGNSDKGVDSASLKIYNALITNNHANGFGGGFAACPTGKTAITDTNGIAIFGNSDGKPDGSYNRSGGSNGKSEDWDFNKENDKGGEITEDFKTAGHQDLFLIRDSTNNPESLPYIAAVTGQMLGGGAANWKGTIDKTPTSIGKYEGAQARYMIGLRSDSSVDDQNVAKGLASLYITGNESNVHGGGIMTNGDVVAGSTTQVKVYPKMKLNGTKALEGRKLGDKEFTFQLLKQNKITKENGEISLTVPSFDKDGKLQLNGCTKVGDGVPNDSDGDFAFNLGEVYSDDSIVYYLVEDPGDNPVSGVTYDETIYKIEFETTPTETRKVLHIDYTYYSVTSVRVTNLKTNKLKEIAPSDGRDVSIKITDDNTDNTFTNAYKPKGGSWTPQVTKKVDGDEMKAFTLELANDENFTNPEAVTIDPAKAKTDENGNATSTVNFNPKNYELKDLENGSKIFTYYVREKDESSTYPHYKFDHSVYEIKVVATDNAKGAIDCEVTYKQIRDRDGNPVDTDDSTPTFTNTYSTSLPLSGMSGVTLTYLAGAAVLCAAAAWMHIRRKANAKGGERRE